MKKSKSLISLMLVLAIVLSAVSLTACEKTYKWEAKENEWVSLDIDVSESEGHYTVNITGKGDVFGKKIPNEAVRLECWYFTSNENSEELIYNEDIITAFQIERESAGKLVITFDATVDYEMINVAVHKSAMIDKLYGDAFWLKPDVETMVYSATILGEHKVYDKNPTLNILLKNTVCADNLTVDMVALEGDFKDLTVTGITGNADNITVTTAGVINDNASQGKVILKSEATLCGTPLDAYIYVKPVGASVVSESYKLVGGKFEFRVQFGNITFTADKAKVTSAIKADGVNIGVKEIGADYAILTIATDAETVDEALDTYSNLSFSIAGSVLSIGKEVALSINAVKARLNFMIDYVSEEGAKYRAEAVLYPLYGNIENITVKDLVFGGDFTGANVESVSREEIGYKVIFTFSAPYDGFDLEDSELNGTLTLSAGKVKNSWGTDGNNVCTYVYTYDAMSRTPDGVVEAINAVGNICSVIASYGSTVDAIGKVASVAGGVAGAAGGVVAILEMTGVIEGTDSKLEALKEAVSMVSEQVKDVSNKIDVLGKKVSDSFSDISMKLDKNTYINACTNWGNYMEYNVAEMLSLSSNFAEQYRLNVIRFLNDPENTEIKIYIDSAGNVTVPGTTTKYSTSGLEITKIYTCVGNKEAVSMLAASMIEKGTFGANRGTLGEEYDKDIIDGFNGNNLLINKETGELITADELTPVQLYYAFDNYFARDAVHKVGIQNIIKAFTSFCYPLMDRGYSHESGVRVGEGYIDNFYTMITHYYNFYDEADIDIQLMRAYLESIFYKARKLAILAQEYTTSTTIVSDADKVFDKALAKKAPGEGVVINYKKPGVTYDEFYVPSTRGYSFVIDKGIFILKWTRALGWRAIIDGSVPLSHEQIKLIYNRYKILKGLGIVKANDFFEYLCGNMAQEILALTEGEKMIALSNVTKPFNPDGSFTLYAFNTKINEYKDADYFVHGQLNTIDLSRSRVRNCYGGLEYVETTFIDLNGNVETKLAYALGLYHEAHGYWVNDECWAFVRDYINQGGIYVVTD